MTRKFFLTICTSQSSVATPLRCAGIFNVFFVASLPKKWENTSVKHFLMIVHSVFGQVMTNKKFELMLTRRAKTYSSSGSVV